MFFVVGPTIFFQKLWNARYERHRYKRGETLQMTSAKEEFGHDEKDHYHPYYREDEDPDAKPPGPPSDGFHDEPHSLGQQPMGPLAQDCQIDESSLNCSFQKAPKRGTAGNLAVLVTGI